VTQPKQGNFVVLDLVPDGTFTQGIEGPATDRHGNLYAVNYTVEGSIGVVRTDGAHKTKSAKFIQLPDGATGNGIRFNRAGHMLVADYRGHNILKIDPRTQGIDIYAHDARMNQPNDLAISKLGDLYLSDPNWSNSTGNLWRVDGRGHITLLESDMGTTNGIEVSSDERYLYVAESVQRKIWRYDITVKGDVENKTLFKQFPDNGLDGMRADRQGNLYVTRYGAGEVVMLSAQGDLIRRIKLSGQFPTNIAFGGPDGRTAYVTMQKRGAIETFRVPYAGRSFALWD
jgi:sugar lactone lactonase YvrE